MIYTINSHYHNKESNTKLSLIRICYSDDQFRDIRERENYSYNPFSEFRAFMGGTREDLNRLYYYFRESKYKSEDPEFPELPGWFVENEEIIDFFKRCTLEKIQFLPLPPKDFKLW